MAKKKIKDQEIVEQWGYLIEGAQTRGEEIFKSVEQRIEELEVPSVAIKKQMISAPTKALLFARKQKKEFLAITNEYLAGYILYVGARDYGKQLSVSWYLTTQLTGFCKWFLDKMPDIEAVQNLTMILIAPIFLLERAFQRVFKGKKSVLPAHMGLFDIEELTAFATTAHHSVLEAVAEIMKSLHQDPSKIDRRSRGFLNIC